MAMPATAGGSDGTPSLIGSGASPDEQLNWLTGCGPADVGGSP